MASLFRTYSNEKCQGVVYTPDWIVCKILDEIGYNSQEILGRTIIDPACGDGRFLSEIVRRVVSFSPKEELQNNLACIYGWDIDAKAVEECKTNLNKIVEFEWNIFVKDSIRQYEKAGLFAVEPPKFDYIVGNPPYIRIQHLDESQRQYIQANYDFCRSGSTDIYIAFYELCLHLLSDKGICGFITPNTFIYTETARTMRKYFERNHNFIKVINFGDKQLFENATTYSAITIFNKGGNSSFEYEKDGDSRQISSFETEIDGQKLGDICDIHVGITTLCDKAYIFPVENIDENYVWGETKLKGRIKLERAVLKAIVKGSKLKHSDEPIKEYVLFPYKRINGKHTIIAEIELKEKYPLAYAYLLSVKSELDKRDAGRPNPVAWYAFGRSQGLDTSFGAKIIFSPMNHKPNFVYYANPDCTFYSGYCIKYNGDVQELLPHLNSERMEKFVASTSRDFRGGWKAYNKNVIENFGMR